MDRFSNEQVSIILVTQPKRARKTRFGIEASANVIAYIGTHINVGACK